MTHTTKAPMELLAPAGDENALVAAVQNGADAVYLGTGAFNARRNAANFDGDALDRAVAPGLSALKERCLVDLAFFFRRPQEDTVRAPLWHQAF